MEYIRIRPMIKQIQDGAWFDKERCEKVTLSYCPKHEHGDVECWQTENCCGCKMAEFKPVER